MARQFEMYWPDFEAIIPGELADAENPKLCEEFWQGLPFQTIFAASMSAGEMFKVPIAFPLTPVLDKDKLLFFPDVPPGTILSMGSLGLLLKYGVVAEPFRMPRLAQIPASHLDRFRNVAMKLKEAYFFTKEVNIVTFRKK